MWFTTTNKFYMSNTIPLTLRGGAVGCWERRMITRPFKAGDVVKHRPTGETWSLIEDEKDGWVTPGGWPPSQGRAVDCKLVKSETPDPLREPGFTEDSRSSGGPAWLRAQAAEKEEMAHAMPSEMFADEDKREVLGLRDAADRMERLEKALNALYGATALWSDSDPKGTAHFLPQLRAAANAALL